MLETSRQGHTEKTSEKEVSHEELLKRILAEHEVFKGIFNDLEEIIKKLTLGQIESKIYYNIPFTAIAVATPNPPVGSPLDPYVYQFEDVYSQLRRIAPKISMVNDGTDTIYVIVSSDGVNWSVEAPVQAGEVRNFYNVWNMGLRSPTAGVIATFTGGIYRLSEFDISSSIYCCKKPNRPAFVTGMVAAVSPPPAVAPIVVGSIPIPNGFSLVVRANVNNGVGQIYLANSAANTAVAANRITLNAGDVVRLFVTNVNLVFVAGSVGGLNVDYVVEQ